MENAKTSLFPLPGSQVVETLYVKLPDGRVVPRSPEEVHALPSDGTLGRPLAPAKPPAAS